MNVDNDAFFDAQDSDVKNVVHSDVDSIFVVVFGRCVFEFGHVDIPSSEG
jgi:hypothetical protein